MLPSVKSASELFLAGLDRIQSTQDKIQREITSGIRVGRASDDPAAVPAILRTQSEIAMNTQIQANLGQVTAELQSGDSALQQAVEAVEQAIALAARGATTSTTASQRSVIAGQIQGLQQQLVTLTRTSVAGRFIFSGDLDNQPMYELDPNQPQGVLQLSTAGSTRTITDAGGGTLWVPKTAQEIFDPRNPDSTPAAGNTFAAINDLLTALQNNDPTAVADASTALKAASDHLNQQLGLYGIAENRVADATSAAAGAIVSERKSLSTLRDTDVAADAILLSQVNIQQQASLSAQATRSKLSLFDFLS